MRHARSASAIVLVLLASCGSNGTTSDAGAESVDAGYEPDIELNNVGPGTLTARANDVITLRAQLADLHGTRNADATFTPTPLPNHRVTWRFTELTGDASLSATTAKTDDAGLVQVTLHISPAFRGMVKMHAETDVGVSNADWTITVP